MLKVLNLVTTTVPRMVVAQSDIQVQAGQGDSLDPAFQRALVAAVVELLRNAKIATELNIVLNQDQVDNTTQGPDPGVMLAVEEAAECLVLHKDPAVSPAVLGQQFAEKIKR
eukprot:GFUD01094705.1.p2 GENE.GFUD01094705.1~~GFUD01094705.1.p2  ORF type:complete len:112 (+),score=32.68 GFUD01094705.1:245-580(+)